MKTFTTLFVLGGLLIFSPLAFVSAQTYAYIAQDGDMQFQEADTPREAINDASQRTPHSGVLEVDGKYEVLLDAADVDVDVDASEYAYISTSGELEVVFAHSAEVALTQSAPDRAAHSGVMLMTE